MNDEKERDAREKMAEHLEQLQQGACYLVDLFPKRVPPDRSEAFWAAERFFLRGKEKRALQRGFLRIMMQLACYYPCRIWREENGMDWREIPLEKIPKAVKDFEKDGCGEVQMLLETEDTLLILQEGTLCLMVYQPSQSVLQLLEVLAQASGFFLRRAEEE